MTALQQHGRAEPLGQLASRVEQVVRRLDRPPEQQSAFVEIRRDDGRQWHDHLPHRAQRPRLEKRIAARRHHDGVDHNGAPVVPPDRVRHGRDDGLGEEHSGFHGRDRRCRRHCVQLRGDQLRRHGVDARDRARSLRRDTSECEGAMQTGQREHAQIRRDARAAAAVRAADRQRDAAMRNRAHAQTLAQHRFVRRVAGGTRARGWGRRESHSVRGARCSTPPVRDMLRSGTGVRRPPGYQGESRA